MGFSKIEVFNAQTNQLATLAKALGHPARVAIVQHLLSVNSCICGDLVNVLPLAQPTVSQHLKELKSAGIIKGSIDGNSLCYCLNPNALQPLLSFIEILQTASIQVNNDCC